MNNGVNNSSSNQVVPGAVVVPPTQVSNANNISNQQVESQSVQQQPLVYATISPVGSTATLPINNQGQVNQTQVSNVNNDNNNDQVNNNVQTYNVNANSNDSNLNNKKKKKKFKLSFVIILVLVFICIYLVFSNRQQLTLMQQKCTPVSTTSGSKELDLDSTIVKDLYSKVYTNLREDLGQNELNDELKLYLAYRQIPTSSLYDSHCNMFVTAGMEPFTCELTTTFVPKAFKEETLQLELKKLFGEDVVVPNQNIQLGNTCIGGFQYIKERGEYVQGQCQSTGATMYRVTKELISATSTEATIVLRERVKYYGSESLNVPERLRSGVYLYTFKLDMNYNYVYVSKTFEE